MVVRNKNPKNSMQKFNDDFESAKFLNLTPFLSDFFKEIRTYLSTKNIQFEK